MDGFLVMVFLIWVFSQGSQSSRPALPATTRLPRRPGSPYGARVRNIRVETVARVGKRDGIKVLAHVEVEGAATRALDYLVRFRLPSGVSVKSRASRYTGPHDELVARARTKPLKNHHASFPNLWVFVPYGAFSLDVGVHELIVQYDLEIDGAWLAEDKSVFYLTQVEGDPAARPAPPTAEEFQVVEAAAASGGECPVCSERVTGEAFVCPRCETLHHLDCWRYNEGCTTYGCAG